MARLQHKVWSIQKLLLQLANRPLLALPPTAKQYNQLLAVLGFNHNASRDCQTPPIAISLPNLTYFVSKAINATKAEVGCILVFCATSMKRSSQVMIFAFFLF
jgi:hypothetical protein